MNLSMENAPIESTKSAVPRKKHVSLDELPEILTAQDIANYLGISRLRVYELFQLLPKAGGIPNFDIGSSKKASKRAIKKDFVQWMEDRKTAKANRFSYLD